MKRQYRDPRDGEVISFISRHAKWARSYGEEIRFRPCPCCKHDKPDNPSTQINSKSGLWRCFACGKTGNFFSLTREFGYPIPLSDRYKEQEFPMINIDWVSFFNAQKRRPVSGDHYPELLEYLVNRGFSREILDRWRISTKGPEAVRIPLYQWEDDRWHMVNARIRVCLRREETNCRDWFEIKGGPTGLLMGNHLINYNGPKRALIFEGQWDAMTASMLGIENAFSLPNGSQNIHVAQMLRYIPEDWDIWICTDMDEQGEDAAEKFFAQLGPERVYRLKIKEPYKDLNQWYQTEPFITEADIEAHVVGIESYQRRTPKKKSDQEFMTLQLDDSSSDERTIISTTPWVKLNKMLGGGFWGGQTTGLLAPSGRGKTTWCNQLATHAACLGTKVGLISLEGTRPALNRKIKEIVVGTFDEEDFKHIQKNLMISPLEGTRVTTDDGVREFDRMIKKGCQLLIFDNLDFITRDDNNLKVKAYASLIELATIHNVHIIVVWQPNKVDRNAIVNSGNQKGYSQTFQDSDNYLNLNIVGGFNILEMEKNRELGVFEDNKVKMKYDPKTRTFIEFYDPFTEFEGKLIKLHA